MVAIRLLSWLIAIAVNVYVDRKGGKPNYLAVFCARGMAAIIHGGLIMDVDDTAEWIPVLTFQVTSYWLVFEVALNIVRKKPILYYDTTENDSGWIDGLFDILGKNYHLVAKLAALVLCVISTIVIVVS